MKKNIYYLEVVRKRVPTSIFDYPCEEINDKLLQNRKIYLHGNSVLDNIADYSSLVPKENITQSLDNATDVIIWPSGITKDNNNQESYLNELSHYHDISHHIYDTSKKCVKNIIFILPAGAATYSTNYVQMADYATLGYIKGLSKKGAPNGLHIYGVVLGETNQYAEVKDLIYFLLSSNSNHLVCNIIRLDR